MAAAGCAPAAPEANAAADIAAVNTVRTAFQTAHNAGDVTGIGNLDTTEAISMGNHEPTATGRDAIMAASKATFAGVDAKLELAADETRTMGTMGFDRGHFKITVTPKAGGPTINDEGRYLVLLEKGADGSWKLTRDINNSSRPMPMPPPPPPPPAAKGKRK
jgi:uncharacterized protein (TIGR02246 family)